MTTGLFLRVSIWISKKWAGCPCRCFEMTRMGLPVVSCAVHRGRADADALLAARLLQPVELRAVEELAEDLRDLRLHDARAVVFDATTKRPSPCELAVLEFASRRGLGPRWDLGEDAGFLAGVERVVDRLLDGGEERLGRVVEAEQVAVLGEELGDGDLALPVAIGSAVARRFGVRGEGLARRVRHGHHHGPGGGLAGEVTTFAAARRGGLSPRSGPAPAAPRPSPSPCPPFRNSRRYRHVRP